MDDTSGKSHKTIKKTKQVHNVPTGEILSYFVLQKMRNYILTLMWTGISPKIMVLH